jgi:hypothetical protein
MSLKFINHKVIFLLAAMVFSIFGMTAKDYFHTAAQQYINGNNEQATSTIDEGLKIYPNDQELIALKGKIKKDQDKKDQNKQDQNKKDQENKDKKDQNKQDQNKKDQQKQEQDKKDQEKKNQQNQNAQDDKKQQQNQQPQPQPKDNKQDMKKEEAKRLIMQFADDADSLNKPPKKETVAGKLRKPEKDW